MLLPKNVNNAIVRHKRPSAKGEQSISSSSKIPSSTMKTLYRPSNRAIVLPQTNVLCCGTRIHFSSGSYWKKVCVYQLRVELNEARRLSIFHVRTAHNLSGIDVQGELRLKGSPQVGPIRSQRASNNQQPPMQRAVMNRHQQARRNPAQVASLHTSMPMSQAAGEGVFSSSPSLQPTPTSQNSSPSTTKSPNFATQGGMSSPSSDLQTQHLQHQQRSLPPQRPRSFPRGPQASRPRGSSGTTPVQHQPLFSPVTTQASPMMQQNYYPPSFQKHYDQLGKLSRSFSPPFLYRALFVLD